jgi:outer membrane protein TolC
MKNILFVILLLISFKMYCEVTLEDCIEAGLEHSGLVRQAELEWQNARLAKITGRLNFLPDVNAYAQNSYGKSGDLLFSKNLSFYQKIELFDERFYQLKSTSIEENISKLKFQEAKRNLIIEITESYTDLLLLKKKLMVYQNSFEIYEKEVLFLKEMLKSGTKTEIDLYSAQIEEQNAILQIKRTEREMENILKGLNRNTGLSLQSESLRDASISYENWDKEISPEQNYQVVNSLQQVELAKTNLKKSFKNLLPTLSLEGNYEWSDWDYLKEKNKSYDSFGNYINPDLRTTDWTVSLTLSYPFGSFFQRRNAYSIAKNQAKKSVIQHEDYFLETTDLFEDAKLDLSLKQEELKIFEQKNELATKKFLLAQAKFRSGMIDFLEFKTAENEKASSEIDLQKAQYDLMISYVKWQKISGEKLFGRY